MPAVAGDSALAVEMPRLAERAIATYRDTDRELYLDNLYRLEIVAGRYQEAGATLRTLRDLQVAMHRAKASASSLPYEIYARARTAQRQNGLPFDVAFRKAYSEIVGELDDRTAANQLRWVFGTSSVRLKNNFREAVQRVNGKGELPLPDAIDLVRKYAAAQAYDSFQSLTAALEDADDRRRYLIDRNIPVRTPDGATVCVLVVRPRVMPGRLAALLNFTIYADSAQNMAEARRTASNGYVAVVALTRGKGCSPDNPIPIEHDGSDARAVIEWISRQAWSDGRVGMYGGSYEGFTQWAAAKRLPKAVKALMPSVTFAPGIDFPMDGNVFMNYAYPWPFYTMNSKALDNATYNDRTRWDRLNRIWYESGRTYRDLARIDGTPNPIFNRWLDHPSYDSYWQSAIPYQSEFARIDIPVLTTTGYYDSGQLGALYYFAQHHKYLARANHYLVIGPYDHTGGQRGTISPLGTTQNLLRGYELDSVAHIDIGELRYEWFDHVFKGKPRPALLKDKVNYQVMGANRWGNAPTLAAVAGDKLRFHLSAVKSTEGYTLSAQRSGDGMVIPQTVDLADRSDVDRMSPDGGIADQALDDWSIVSRKLFIGNAIAFVSEPFVKSTEVSGLFSGRLDFSINKKDFDFSVTLYELTPAGDYVHLSYYWARASYMRDRSQRRLLTPGNRERLAFESGRLTSRQFQAGSRLLVVIGVLKQSGEQINYGTGKDVSDETISDAGVPLRIRWSGASFIDLPIRR